jgi:hypothetical protein
MLPRDVSTVISQGGSRESDTQIADGTSYNIMMRNLKKGGKPSMPHP